nr:MAG TPA_asm: hypothetical protein [Caudoviricetes sp.]
MYPRKDGDPHLGSRNRRKLLSTAEKQSESCDTN